MNVITIEDWRQYFPFNKIRPEQEKAINFILNSFINEGKTYCVCELSTGVGKSATGVCIARYLEEHGGSTVDDEGIVTTGAYILTTQKVLQQQYLNDFGPGTGASKNLMLSIKSATNYTCGFYPDQSCAESRRVLTQLKKHLAGTDFQKSCGQGNCCYVKDKSAFIESPISITNFSYFLAETMYGKQLLPRSLLVIDEAHNVESELGKFIEVTFSEKFSKDVLKCKNPALDTQEAIFNWISEVYKPKLAKHIKALEKSMTKHYKAGLEGFSEFSKQYETLDKHICKVNRFITSYSPENWIVNIIKPIEGNKRGGRKFEFKPIDVSRFAHDMLFKFGSRTLMMSATIINKDVFCKTIGLDPNDVAFLSLPSPFPIANKPVHYLPVGSMSLKNIKETLPILAETVKMLLGQHPNEKGVIHCVNYKIAQYLLENVKSPRLLAHNSENRDITLKSHTTGTSASVLLSPSMMEGVDLADDASRFQILCKIPFPYLGDEVIKKRMENNKAWYAYQTVKTIVQAMGRSVRNENDYATSYILDTDWERFYKNNSSMFPSEFSATLI